MVMERSTLFYNLYCIQAGKGDENRKWEAGWWGKDVKTAVLRMSLLEFWNATLALVPVSFQST